MTEIIKRRRRIDPKKTGSQQISKSVYFYPDEHETIRKAAAEEGVSVSAYVTKAAYEKAKAHFSK